MLITIMVLIASLLVIASGIWVAVSLAMVLAGTFDGGAEESGDSAEQQGESDS